MQAHAARESMEYFASSTLNLFVEPKLAFLDRRKMRSSTKSVEGGFKREADPTGRLGCTGRCARYPLLQREPGIIKVMTSCTVVAATGCSGLMDSVAH